MAFLKRHKLEIVIFVLFGLLFFLSRLYSIASLPIFTDEAIYTRWSQIARYDPGWRFISLTDGKQPLFVWITMNMMRFVKDPLLAGRLVSVAAGFITFVGLFFLGKEIFKNTWVGIISSALYLIFPMALVYDRMALYDSMVGTFAVWSLYFQVLLVRRLRLDIALILGMVMGGGVLTKTSGFFSIYLFPFSLLLFNLQPKKRVIKFLKWVGLAIIATIFAYGYYSILRLFPLFHVIAQKNSVFVYPLNEWIIHPFNFLYGNLGGLLDWFKQYSTWPIIILMICSFFVSLKYTKEKLLLLIWFLIPFVALALFGRVLYPRFIFFMILPLLPLAALTIYKLYTLLSNKLLFVACCLLLVALALRSDYYILTDFKEAPIPGSDLGQYVNDWPAGGGVKEIISFLQKEASKGKIYVASEGTFGSLPTYAVEIYLGDNRNIEKRGIWPVPKTVPDDLMEKAKAIPVYFIFNETQNPDSSWPIKLLLRYQKGKGNSYMSLYKITP